MISEVGQDSPTAFKGPRQLWTPRRIVLASFSGDAGAAGSIRFRLETPDSRVRTKVSILFVPAAGTSAVTFAQSTGAQLWLYETEADQTGTSGLDVPCVDIEGTFAAPTAIPKSSGLAGYSREFVTIGDGVEGQLSFPIDESSGGPKGTVALQTRFQPDGQRLPFDEWDEVRRQCSINLIGSPFIAAMPRSSP